MSHLYFKGRDLLMYLKDRAEKSDLEKLISVGSPVQAYLRPVATCLKNLDPEDIELLTKWRNKHVKSFLTEFEATNERTRNWLLNQVHSDHGKILFMLVDLEGKRIGQIGLGFINWQKRYGEADAIISGGESPRGLMKAALKEALAWAKSELLLSELCVRVRSDNSALYFY